MNINVSDISGQTAGEAEAGAPFRVERLGARLGAQIHGLDLKQAMSPAAARAFEGCPAARYVLASVNRNSGLWCELIATIRSAYFTAKAGSRNAAGSAVIRPFAASKS